MEGAVRVATDHDYSVVVGPAGEGAVTKSRAILLERGAKRLDIWKVLRNAEKGRDAPSPRCGEACVEQAIISKLGVHHKSRHLHTTCHDMSCCACAVHHIAIICLPWPASTR